jgi:hypothetical protein
MSKFLDLDGLEYYTEKLRSKTASLGDIATIKGDIATIKGDIAANTTAIDAEKTRAAGAEQNNAAAISAAAKAADAAQADINTLLPKTDFSTENTVKKYIDDNVNTLNTRIDTNVVYFNTVADMQAFTNFKNGMMCRTKGFNSADDMGGAYYSISDTGVVNGMDIIQCGKYVATLIKSEFVSVAQLGAVGNGTNNDAPFILRALEISDSISFSEKTYFINSDITINNKTVYLNNGEIFSQNKTIIVENQSEICCGTLNGTNLMTRDAKNHVHDILIKDWIGTALTVDGYENFISHIRLENDNNDETVGVEIVKADNTISFIYGHGAHTGIKVNNPDSYIDNVHLWLNGNNKFTDSKFVDVSSTLVSFTNCCCDSYETFANITADYLLIKFVNCYWITNSDIFKNKSYVLFKCPGIHNYNISGNISCRLVGMANVASTLNFGSVANVNIDVIDGDLGNAPIAQYQAYTLQNNSEYLFKRDGYISAQVWKEDSYVDVLFIGYTGVTYHTSHITKDIKGSLIFVPEGTKIKVTISGSNASVTAALMLGYAMPS